MRTYRIWCNPVDRCSNSNYPDWKHYGVRSPKPITLCHRWQSGENGITGFRCFVTDMAEWPPDLTIERRDNDDIYWADMKKQTRTRGFNVRITLCAESLCISKGALES
jgi:hypothetical protein